MTNDDEPTPLECVLALIGTYNAAEAAQATRRGAIFDAVAALGVGHRMSLRSHFYSWHTTWTGGVGGTEYELHRERFVQGGDASITDHDIPEA
jgi:hypothetical protein